MFCPHCGVQNADGASACTACSTILPQMVPAPGASGATQPQPDQNVSAALAVLYRRVASGGNWFYWIAGMSLLNTVMGLAHGGMSFLTGLGVTQLIDEGMRQLGGRAMIILLPLNLIFAGLYIVFGYFACRRALWAFVAGIVCYSLDTLLVLAVQFFPGLLFHAFALLCIAGGLKALNSARKLEAQQAQTLVRY